MREVNWVVDLSTDELEMHRDGLRNGIDGGRLSMCRRELDEQTLSDMDAELERRSGG